MDSPTMQEMADLFGRGIARARKLGATNVKLSFSRHEGFSCHYSNGRLKSTDSNRGMSYGICAIVDGRLSGASGNRLRDFDTLLQRAVELAPHGNPVYFDRYPEPSDYAALQTYSERTADLGRDKILSHP